jgi:signal transduction histidine kinase
MPSFCVADLEPYQPARDDCFAGLPKLLLLEQEEERHQIAADLHDEIGQCLSAVQFAIGGLRQQLGERVTDVEDDLFECLTERVAKASQEVRRICMGLRPPMLDDLGLVSTIEWFCAELGKISASMQVIQEVHASEDAIPAPVKIAIFRIMQEACSNACKHSGAERLTIRLDADAEGVRLEVADDGVGFEPAVVTSSGCGLGLAIMCERASMTDGRLTIESRPGAGSCIFARWCTAD